MEKKLNKFICSWHHVILKSAGWSPLHDVPASDILRSQIATRKHFLFSYLQLKSLFFLMVN